MASLLFHGEQGMPGPRLSGVRLLTRNGYDWAHRFPLIAEAAGALQVRSFLVDGEAVCCDHTGVAVFEKLRGRREDRHVFLYAFDLIEINGQDLRREPIEIRAPRLSQSSIIPAAIISSVAPPGRLTAVRAGHHG
jgi:ATP-dependent DNA ligase